MDTIYEESQSEMNAKKKAKAIEVIEVEFENVIYADNDRIVRKYFQMGIAFVANLLFACYGLTCSASGFIIPQLEDPVTGFGISKEDGSWIASMYVVGCLVGSFVGGWQSEKLGRKKSMMIDCSVFIIGMLITCLTPNTYVLLLARFLVGHASLSSVVSAPIYTSETSQPEVRRMTGSFAVMCYTTGCAFCQILGAIFTWRYATAIPILIPTFALICLFFCPESPVWLLKNEKDDEALKVLTRIRGSDNEDIINAEFNRISINLKISQKEAELDEEVGGGQGGIYQKISNHIKLFADPTFIKPVLLLMVMFCLAHEWCGFPASGFYMVPMLQSVNIPINPYWGGALLYLSRAMMSILGSSFIGRYHRRPIYLTCTGLVFCGNMLLATFCYLNEGNKISDEFPVTRWIPFVAILSTYAGFSFGVGSICFMLLGEILPAHARSFGCSFVSAMDCINMFISTKMVPTFFQLLGVHGAFYMYSGFVLLVGILCFFFMPETSGMSLEEIEQMYRSKKKSVSIK